MLTVTLTSTPGAMLTGRDCTLLRTRSATVWPKAGGQLGRITATRSPGVTPGAFTLRAEVFYAAMDPQDSEAPADAGDPALRKTIVDRAETTFNTGGA